MRNVIYHRIMVEESVTNERVVNGDEDKNERTNRRHTHKYPTILKYIGLT